MNRIKQLRDEIGMTQIQLSEKLNKTQQQISLYEKGTNELDLDGYIILSNLFGCSIEYIAGKSNIRNPNSNLSSGNFKNIPVVGKISAGQPILVQENIEGYLPVDPNIYGLTSTDDLFYLLVSGRSMDKKVKNGDYALIHKQDYAEDGDIVVALVNGDDEATLKKYKKLNAQFVLLEPMSTDPSIEAITVDLKSTDFKIVGKAIGQFGKF